MLLGCSNLKRSLHCADEQAECSIVKLANGLFCIVTAQLDDSFPCRPTFSTVKVWSKLGLHEVSISAQISCNNTQSELPISFI
jgi:hypothetical protein